MIENLAGSWWIFVLIGLVTGVLSGTLGVGGGVIMVPILVLMVHLPQKSAQGVSLAVMVPMALLGAVQYWRQGDSDMRLTVLMLLIAGALVGAMMGTEIAHRLPGALLRKMFAVLLLVIGVKMILTPEQSRIPGGPERTEHDASVHASSNP